MRQIIAKRILSLLLLAALCAVTASATVVEEIIAQVNERIILLSEYNRGLEMLRQDLSQESKGLDLEANYNERVKHVLRDLIDQRLLVEKAAELGVNVDTEVVKRLDAIRIQMNLPSMEALEEEVAKQRLNYEDFKQNLRDNILTQQIINREVGSRVVVTPGEISAYYEKHKNEMEQPEGLRILQILISTDGKPEAEVPELQKKAEEVLAQARSGGDFAELARKNSEDATAASGGDAGFFELGTMAPEIEKVALSLKKGGVSDIIRTKYGFLILKLVEHTQAGVPPLSSVETKIHERIYYEKIQPALREYLTTLRQESFITVKAGYVDTGAAPPQAAAAKKP